MPNNLPTASVTGRQEWEWNRWRSEQDSPDEPSESTDRQPSGRPDPGESRRRRETVPQPRNTGTFDAEPGRRERRLQRIIEELEAKLERKEQRIQYIIEHYERLLSEKNRKLAAQNSTRSNGETPVLTRVLGYLAGH